MIRSVDFPVETLMVINNGNLQLWETAIPPTIRSFYEYNSRQNMGVAGSWNLAMDYAFNQQQKDAVLIVGNDIIWMPGDLNIFWQTAIDSDADFIFGNHSYSSFMVKRSGWEKVGAFNETFYPAYLEDSCHWQIIRRSPNVKIVHVDGLRTGHVGSATIDSDSELKRTVQAAQARNWKIYSEMWGCPMWSGGQEAFATPYNKGGPLNEWKLDEERLKLPHFYHRWPQA